ncbi:hypothetical protein LK542_21495 [Massilia sp. IC2-477]|uniref:hypothetical protein n=1 Tax=Massilia sp. IC2-477 TaxID=2887198 RepID=UPI001D0FD9C1|nr:hypothetical protein [Massilia sp. IC2-477]MCC2958203.1 hypothetical protein [Massilia sp. IC2-477]
MTSWRTLSLPLMAFVPLAASIHAETPDVSNRGSLACPAVQDAAGHAEPGEVVRELYRLVSGPPGKGKDWARLRDLHALGAIITVPQHVGDRVDATTYNVEGFAALNDKLFGQRGFYEVELRQETQKFGHVAHVWSAYASSEHPGGRPYAYGINSFQLLNDGKRWCVVSATWDGDASRHVAIRDWARLPAAPVH